MINLLAHQPPITGNLEDNLEVNRKVVEERMKEEKKNKGKEIPFLLASGGRVSNRN